MGLRKLLSAVVLGGLLLAAAPARADFFAAAAVDGVAFFDERMAEEATTDVRGGVSVAASFGYAFVVPLVDLTPELAVTYSWFDDAYDRNTVRITAGLRLIFPFVVSPSLFAHVGWGYAEGIDQDAVLQRSGLTFDAGVAVHFWLAQCCAVGAQAAYNALYAETGSGMETASWVTAGAHAAFRF